MDSPKNQKLAQTDILIVGNGALGLFLAEELIERKIRKNVAVIGPRDREGGASQAAGAMLGCFSEVTTETLRSDAGRVRFEIGLEAHDRWDSTLQRLQEASPTNQLLKVANDTYVILNSIGGELDSDNFAAIITALDTYEKPWKEVDPHDVNGFKPKPNCRAFRAIQLPEGAVDARVILAVLEAKLHGAGVPIIDQTVRKIQSKCGAVTGVELHDGSVIEADIVVVAAGARSEELIHSASDDLDILPTFQGLGLGMIAKRSVGEPFRSVVRTPNRGFACGLHVIPAGDGREYLGATNRIVPHATNAVWLEDLNFITQCVMQQLDEDAAYHQIERWLLGVRPITLDSFPLIGALPLSGLHIMTGTYRDGLHSAPQLAIHVANKLEGLPGIIDPMFEPTRKPIVTRTIEYSIEEFVQHSLATWYETGGDAPMPNKKLTSLYRDQATKQYDVLGINYALSPDLLWYTIRYLSGAPKITRYFT